MVPVVVHPMLVASRAPRAVVFPPCPLAWPLVAMLMAHGRLTFLRAAAHCTASEAVRMQSYPVPVQGNGAH